MKSLLPVTLVSVTPPAFATVFPLSWTPRPSSSPGCLPCQAQVCSPSPPRPPATRLQHSRLLVAPGSRIRAPLCCAGPVRLPISPHPPAYSLGSWGPQSPARAGSLERQHCAAERAQAWGQTDSGPSDPQFPRLSNRDPGHIKGGNEDHRPCVQSAGHGAGLWAVPG